MKLLQCCYIKVSTAQCSNCTRWLQGLTAILLIMGWRGNGGSVCRYWSAVTLQCLQHSAIIVQGGYRDWLQFYLYWRGNGCSVWSYCSAVTLKVSIAQSNNCTGWIQGLTAVLLATWWRGNGGSVWSYCGAVTFKCLQHCAIIVQGGYRDWLQFYLYWVGGEMAVLSAVTAVLLH